MYYLIYIQYQTKWVVVKYLFTCYYFVLQVLHFLFLKLNKEQSKKISFAGKIKHVRVIFPRIFFVVLFSVFDILNLKIFLVYLDVLPKSMLKNFEIKYFHYIKKDYLQNDMNTLLHVFAKPSAYAY